MKLDVAFLPFAALDVERRVCIVVDALRASASIVAMLDAGAGDVQLAASVDEARTRAALDREQYWLVGEVNGQKPADFDFCNSPTELASADLPARSVVYATSNGTRALAQVAASPLVLVGGLPNASAIVGLALEQAARRDLGLCIVCSGDDGGTLVSLEDLVSAGVLVELLCASGLPRVLPEDQRSCAPNCLALDESAEVARRLYRSYLPPGTPPLPVVTEALRRAFDDARNGRHLPRIGYAADVTHCRTPDTSAALPALSRRNGIVRIVPAGPRPA